MPEPLLLLPAPRSVLAVIPVEPKSEPHPGGRPTVITEAAILKLEEAFKIDATVLEACAYAGITKTPYYDRLKDDPEFADRMDRAQQFPFMMAKKTVYKAMQAGDARTALKWLDRRQRDRYHTKVEQEVKGGI